MSRWACLFIMTLLVSGCGSGYDKIADLQEATGCGDDTNSEGKTSTMEVVGCSVGAGDETRSLYLYTFADSEARDEELDLLRLLPTDGTSGRWVVYDDTWMVECFDLEPCEGYQDEMGGELEVIDEGGQPADTTSMPGEPSR